MIDLETYKQEVKDCLIAEYNYTVHEAENLIEEYEQVLLTCFRKFGFSQDAAFHILWEAGQMNMETYKQRIRKCLTHGLTTSEMEAYADERIKLYEDEFPQFLEEGWTPGTVAAALIMGA